MTEAEKWVEEHKAAISMSLLLEREYQEKLLWQALRAAYAAGASAEREVRDEFIDQLEAERDALRAEVETLREKVRHMSTEEPTS